LQPFADTYHGRGAVVAEPGSSRRRAAGVTAGGAALWLQEAAAAAAAATMRGAARRRAGRVKDRSAVLRDFPTSTWLPAACLRQF
jgi:hypothetical protein